MASIKQSLEALGPFPNGISIKHAEAENYLLVANNKLGFVILDDKSSKSAFKITLKRLIELTGT